MRIVQLFPGFVAVAAIVAVAAALGQWLPLVGMPVVALALGVLAGALRRPSPRLEAGVAFASRQVLQAAIVLSGFALSVGSVFQTGWLTLPVTLATIAVALIAAPLVGRWLRIDSSATTLIGVGTAICGASAVAAVSAVLEPDAGELSLAIGVIFVYNVLAVLIFPPIGHALQLSQQAFGVWAGTAVNDTSSVVAAGYAYGVPAGIEATIVKLSRAMLIVPIVAAIAALRAARLHGTATPIAWRRIVPWFIVWFVLATLLNSAGFVPTALHPVFASAAIVLIGAALAAIGLQTDLRRFAASGARPLALGLVLWLLVATVSLLVQHAVHLT